jgi:uncharacterized protein
MSNDALFSITLAVSSISAGVVASISGFGIGSLLTPLLAVKIPLSLAVALVSIPHFMATALRCWLLRDHIEWKTLKSFGAFSALGGLAGAMFLQQASNAALVYLFAALLIYVGVGGLSGWTSKFVIGQKWSWLAGIASGLLGGLVGNQGGIRSAALTGMHVSKESFVATATAIGVIVDVVRLPIYLYAVGGELGGHSCEIAITTLGCLAGTLLGRNLLERMPEKQFRTVLYILLIGLGVFMALK